MSHLVQVSFPVIIFLGVVVSGAAVILLSMVSMKKKRVEDLEKELLHFQDLLKDLDEEAKLIIRTDFELNRTQEKLQKLSAFLEDMQQFSENAISTLDERLLFSGLTKQFIGNLGFQKCLAVYVPDRVKHVLDFNQQQIQLAVEFIQKNAGVLSEATIAVELKRLLGLVEAEVRGIRTKKGLLGFIIFANETQDSPGIFVKEMVVTLTNVLSQAVDNIGFFEEAFQKRTELEDKVRSRTREVVEAMNELKRINKMKSDFISSVSHELRTPLTSIKGYASLLAKGKFGDLPADVKVRLERIDDHTNKLVEMVNGLLDIARIESGRQEVKLAPYNINGIIKDVAELLYPQAKAKNVEVIPQLTEGELFAILDKELIERVLINLINNALKFTPENGKIFVSVQSSDAEVTVGVRDTGIGIAEEDINKVFEEFYRVENEINAKVKGTGLGLPLVKKIIEQAHGGRIWAKSKLREGSEFLFTLKRK